MTMWQTHPEILAPIAKRVAQLVAESAASPTTDLRSYASKLLTLNKLQECEDALFFHLKTNRLDILAHLVLVAIFTANNRSNLADQHRVIASQIADAADDTMHRAILDEFNLLIGHAEATMKRLAREDEEKKEQARREAIRNELDEIREHQINAVGRAPKLRAEAEALSIHNRLLFNRWDFFRGDKGQDYPTKDLLNEHTFDDYYLKNLTPETSFISKDMNIMTFGSCFARHITEYLREHDYKLGGQDDAARNSYAVWITDGMVNTYTLLQQFEWAFENKEYTEPLWFDEDNEALAYTDDVRITTRRLFNQADVFIITLGLSEIWFNKQTDDVLMRFVPRRHFKSDVHGFRLTTVDENLINLEKIYRTIRKIKKDSTIIFTLSPIPLSKTFRHIPCPAADSVSKSILRVAVDELTRNHADDARLFYFPAYEIVKTYFTDPYEADMRHVKPDVVKFVMSKFARHFLVGADQDA